MALQPFIQKGSHIIRKAQRIVESPRIESLFQGCREGKREAQEMLYQLTCSKMLGLCLRYANTTFEAEDILQIGYVKVFTKIADFQGKGSFEGWIRRIMVNTAISHYRQNRNGVETIHIEEHHETENGGSALDLDHMEYSDLIKLVQQLPDGFRMVFNLYALEGYSHKEIAGMLNIQESTSKSQLSRAREWLRKKIKAWEENTYA